MIFVDSNIPMYLVGAPQPVRVDAQVLVERCVAGGERIVTDAEVLQEILHRYSSIGRKEAIGPALKVLLNLVDEVFPIDRNIVMRASEIVQGSAGLSARDAVHLAAMERHRITRIMSFDSDFDRWPGITRLSSFDA